MAARGWAPSLGADAKRPVRKEGALHKLPRRTLATSASWQARDFVLDSDAGTLAYFGAGESNNADKLKNELPLEGARARPVEGKVCGKAFCLVVENGKQTLTLAAATPEDRDAWLVAVRAAAKKLAISTHWRGGAAEAAATSWPEARAYAPASKADAAEERDVAAVQDQTLDAIGRMRRQLHGTQEIAGATSDTLRQQDEQLAGINRDLDRANAGLREADKRLDSLESWRIFGGKSKKQGRRAEKLARRASEREADARRDGDADEAAPPPARRLSSKRSGSCSSLGDPERRPSRGGSSLGDDRRLSRAASSRASLGEEPRRPSRRSSSVTLGLEGRTDEEAAALERIAARDAEVDRGLDDLDGLLDALGDQARAMNRQVRRQGSRLDTVRDDLHDAEVGTARVNARARHNVGYFGRPDL